MQIGNLLGKLKGKDRELSESFLALVLTNNLVQSAVWQIVEGKTEIISLGTPVEWDGEVATTNELIQAVDATISSATEGIMGEPTKIIFGLTNSWVELKGILSSKKELIKSICKELEFTPLGYVVLSDCILKYLKMQEGTPTTSILVQLGHRELTLSLVKLGRIEGSITVAASENISEDVAEAISRFPDGDPFPSRFIIVGSMENTSEIVQELTAYDWTAKFNFLHTPKIEALPKDIEVHATAVAGGTEVATSLGIVFDAPVVSSQFHNKSSDQSDISDSSDISESSEFSESPILSASDVGFTTTDNDNIVEARHVSPAEIIDESEPTETSVPTPSPKFIIPHLSLPKSHLPAIKIPKLHVSLFMILVPIMAIIIGLVSFIYFVPHATLTILLRAKPLEQVVSLNLSDQIDSVDLERRLVPAEKLSESITGTKSTPATGEKTIGDPATGEVTIYNRTSLSKTFLKGTTLTSGSLKFTLDEDITIASKSAGADYVDVPGKANAKIFAKAIGIESNLPSGTEFTVATFGKDSYIAKNESALTGGSSQVVTVISSDDKKTLIQGLTTDLLSQLKDKLIDSSGDTYYILESDIKISEEQYSGKVGEVGTNLDGTITLDIPILKYKTSDVEALLGSEVSKSVPSGYLRTTLPSVVNLVESKVDDEGVVHSDAHISIYVVPQIDTNSLIAEMKGVPNSKIVSILRSIPGYVNYDLVISPRYLPPRLQFLPLNPQNISISVTPSI